MSPKETPQVPEESQQATFNEPKEEVCEAQQRRGQYAAHVDYTEPPGRGQYVSDVENPEIAEGIKPIESEPTTP